MINQLIRQLNSPDPKRRIKAIKALAKTGDRAALGPLLKVYKSDSDAKVRELALKAGRYIKKHAATPIVVPFWWRIIQQRFYGNPCLQRRRHLRRWRYLR